MQYNLPSNTPIPFQPSSASIGTTGHLVTSLWHGGVPEIDKAAVSCTIIGKNFSTTRTAVVYYGRDGATNNTHTLATFNGTDAVQTKFFSAVSSPQTNAVGKLFQFRIELNSDDSTSPEIYAFIVHFSLRPDRVRAWETYVVLGGLLNNGQEDPEAKATKLTSISTLETQDYPIVLEEDFDGDGSFSSITAHIVGWERAPDEVAKEFGGQEVYRLVIQEVVTA